MKKMILFGIILAVLLIGQRLDWGFANSRMTDASINGRVLAVEGSQANVAINDVLKRRQTIETQSETFVLIEIVPGLRLAMDQRTQIRLDSHTDARFELRLGRGRIAILNENRFLTVVVKTNQTSNQFTGGWATFVNYDFKDELSILPIGTEVETHLSLTDLTISSAGPVAIHESNPVKYGVASFNTKVGAAAAFYAWADSMMPPPSISSPE